MHSRFRFSVYSRHQCFHVPSIDPDAAVRCLHGNQVTLLAFLLRCPRFCERDCGVLSFLVFKPS